MSGLRAVTKEEPMTAVNDPREASEALWHYCDTHFLRELYPRAAEELARLIERGRSPQKALDEVLRMLTAKPKE